MLLKINYKFIHWLLHLPVNNIFQVHPDKQTSLLGITGYYSAMDNSRSRRLEPHKLIAVLTSYQ